MLWSAFYFSLMSLLVKWAGQRLPAHEIVFVRAFISLVLSYGLLRRAGISPWGRQKKWLLVRGLFGFAGLSCFFYALTALPLAEVTVLQYLHPIFTTLLAAVFLRERVGWALLISIPLSLAGVILVTQPAWLFAGGDSLPWFPTSVALVGAFMSAAAYTTVRSLSKTEHSLVIVFYFPLIAMPASIPTLALDFVLPRGWDWLILLGIGITTQLGQVMLTRGLRSEAAGRATALGYTQVVFAATWGWLFFGERPDVWAVLGAGLVLSGTLVIAFTGAKSASTAADRTLEPHLDGQN